MGFPRVLATIGFLALLAELTVAADLAKIPRAVAKEPAYKTKPKYCLLVFGPEAKTRIWLIEDGDTFYVDRNGNGDLTEPGEAVEATDRREFMTSDEKGNEVPYRDRKYVVGTLSAAKTSNHTDFKVSRYQIGKEPPEYVISGKVNGITLQYAGWGSILADSPATAPIIHFGGSVVPQAIRVKSLKRGKNDQELHLRFGTPGIGKNSFASIGYSAIPETVHPIVEIEWPSSKGPPIKTSAKLTQRC
jgi:hypothetical protein